MPNVVVVVEVVVMVVVVMVVVVMPNVVGHVTPLSASRVMN